MSAHHLTRVKVGERAPLENLPFSSRLARTLLNQIQVQATPVPVLQHLYQKLWGNEETAGSE